MQFYSAYFLNLLWLTPILAVSFILSGWLSRKRTSAFLKTGEIQNKLLPHYNQAEWPIRATLLLLGFIFSVVALAQPQWGEEKKKIERTGIDIIFMLDVSGSMLAEDIKPSRIQKAKFEIESFVKELKGDRIGMLTFAGSSFMQTPLTLDYSAFLIFLNGVGVGDIPDPGTSLGHAIEKAINSFPDEKSQHRALIVFTDGEDHEQQVEPALALAKKKNVRIYTIGTGTPEGAPIPLRSASTGVQTAVKKDRSGNIVITKLNKDVLEKSAGQTGGIYLPATPGEKEVRLVLKHLSTMGNKKLEDRLISEREDHYQIFLFFALLCLIIEMLIRRGQSSRAIPFAALFFVFILNSGFSTPQKTVEDGNADFEGKRYQSATQKYREVQVKHPDSPPVEYNLATSLYKLDQYQESAAHLKNAVEKSGQDKELQAKAAYNYGNALYRTGDYEGAIAAYKKALELNPSDKDAKYNLEFIQDKKSKTEKENQDRKKDNQDKKNDKNKQKDNKNQQQNQKKDQQNQGGGASKDQNQQGQGGKDDKQQGGEQQNQDQKQNQGGSGQNQQNSGNNQDPDKKDQGQGKNQQDQNQQNQSDSQKDQNQGGSGNQDQEKNQSQSSQQNPSNQGGKGQDQAQPQDQGSNKPDQEKQGQGQNADQKSESGQGGNQQQSNQQKQQKDDQKPQGQSGQGQKSDQQSQQPNQSQQGQNSGQSQNPNQTGQQGQGGLAGKPLQGQMTKEDAEYLLGSLEDGEKKFHVLRKPAKEDAETAYAEKDW